MLGEGGGCKLVDYCLPVQGSLLIDARGPEKGAVVNASGGRLAQDHLSSKEPFYKNNPTVPQCHSLPASTTKSPLKPTVYGPIHPPDPDALAPLWDFLWFNLELMGAEDVQWFNSHAAIFIQGGGGASTHPEKLHFYLSSAQRVISLRGVNEGYFKSSFAQLTVAVQIRVK